jgi:hypothetical protein
MTAIIIYDNFSPNQRDQIVLTAFLIIVIINVFNLIFLAFYIVKKNFRQLFLRFMYQKYVFKLIRNTQFFSNYKIS